MKKILYLITLLLSFYTFAQEYPLKTSSFDVPPYGYIKDTNNEYDKYLGLWKGEWNGKTLYIELKKVKRLYNEVEPFYRDEIMGERKIIDANGIVEIDRISNFDYEHPEFRGLGMFTNYNGQICETIMFYPKNMCNMHTSLIITKLENLLTINNPNGTSQMTLHWDGKMEGGLTQDCIHDAYAQQHGEYPVNFPKDIVLTKQ